MKSREELILDFMLAMSPQVAKVVLNNQYIEPISTCNDLAYWHQHWLTHIRRKHNERV